jgi:hypothetical protein
MDVEVTKELARRYPLGEVGKEWQPRDLGEVWAQKLNLNK